MNILRSPFGFKSVIEMISYYKDEENCLEYLEQSKWGGKITCAKCGCEKIYKFVDKKRYKCSGCGNHFTAKVGTIFQDSKIPLLKWFIAMYYMSNLKKGMSSRQLAAEINVTQRTAWFMQHRIRESYTDTTEKMGGKSRYVEADETFVGGKNKNRHMDKRVQMTKDRNFRDKTPVMGIIEPEGKVRAFVIPNTKRDTLCRLIYQNVQLGVALVTDEWEGYNGLDEDFFHETVEHGKQRYRSDGGFSTNRIEGFWTHLKRSLGGIYHRVSPKHLQRYVNESAFRYNFRNHSTNQRLHASMQNINRVLKYKQLVHGKEAA